MRAKGLILKVIVIAMAAAFVPLPWGPMDEVEAGTISVFSSGNASEVYTFNQAGMQDTIYLKVPVDGTVISAQFDVTGEGLGVYEYPTNVRVFVGAIGKEVYRYQGPQYGAMGFQYQLTDGSLSKTIVYETAGTDDTMFVRMPRGADVVSSSVRFKGELQDAGWAQPLKLSHQVGSNFIAIDAGYMSSPQLIDWDGDGDLDLLSGGLQYNPRRYLWYFENTGTNTSATWSEDTSEFASIVNDGGYYSVPRLVDLDLDGDHDMIWGRQNGSIQLYWNTGSDASPTWTDDGWDANSCFFYVDEGYYAMPDFGDMDNDGDLDLAYGRYAYQSGESNVGVSSFRNDYNNNVWSWATTNFFGGISTDMMSAPHLVDFDGDGDNDMFVGYYNGTIGFWENVGSKTSPKWKYNAKTSGNIDVGTRAIPYTGDLDGDGDLDLVVGEYNGEFWYYENLRSHPTDPKLDIGKDGDVDFSYSGELSTTVTATGLEDEIESHIQSQGRPDFRDDWGNVFDDILFSLRSDSPGRMVVDQIRIVYTYTMGTHDFAGILADYISDHKDEADDEGNIKVPIIVSSTTKGKIKLDNLKVVIDEPPRWKEIPSTYAIDEDTKDLKLIDLHLYASDDFDGLAGLKFEVVQVDQKDKVTVSLQAGRYVGIDAETGEANDDWNGKVTVYVVAWDKRNQKAESNQFTIEVRSVNDVPELVMLPPDVIDEDKTLKFTITASDVDGDQLTLTIENMPAGMKLEDGWTVFWVPTNDDVGTYAMTITVRDPSGASDTFLWNLTVRNVNDPPEIDLPTEITVTEGEVSHLDIGGGIHDVDNDLSELMVEVASESPWITMSDLLITLAFPKESGFDYDHIMITVIDPMGAMASIEILVKIIKVDKLALFGIPDQTAVEEDTWVLDIKPYLHNVEDFNKLIVSTSSSYITVSGTKLTLHYPQDSLPDLTETVVVTAKQRDEVATASFVVKLLALGHDLTLAPIPDQDVLETEVHTLDVTPYIRNAPLDEVTITVQASEFVSVAGKVITFKYPLYHGPETEAVKVVAQYREFGADATFTVRILNSEDDFYLAEIPDVQVTETVPETFNIKQYIINAYDISHITTKVEGSAYADVNGFDIQLLYPEGFTGGEKTKDDLVWINVSDGFHYFRRSVTVHVERLGKELALSGIGDRTVYVDTDLVIDLEPYLYNVDDWADVRSSVAPAMYATQEGLVYTLRFPAEAMPKVTMRFTVTEGEDVAEEAITVYIEEPPSKFSFGVIGSITVLEGKAYKLDVAPYLKNMAPGTDYVLGVHSDYATVTDFVVTFLYDVETVMDEIVRINVTGSNGDFAEQDVYVHVNTVNDPPVLSEPMSVNYNVVEGEGPVVMDLREHFTDVDTEVLHFSTEAPGIVIDNVNGTATIEFPEGADKPDDLVDVVIVAYDPDEPSSKVPSNKFNVTFYTADEPGPGPGPGPDDDGPSVQSGEGGSGWILAAIIVVAAIVGGGWMYYRRRKPAVEM